MGGGPSLAELHRHLIHLLRPMLLKKILQLLLLLLHRRNQLLSFSFVELAFKGWRFGVEDSFININFTIERS